MADTLHSGDRIGNYRIIELIGEGGMGKVYQAKQLSMNRIVALKVLSFRREKLDPHLKSRFINEARTAGKLNHENIIHVYDVGKAEDTFYFSMEFVDGDSVGDMLKERDKFDVVTGLTIAKGILKALVAARNIGIVHRDIKPDNIIIARDGITKLADLGLAKRTDLDKGGNITQEGVVMGTPHYMSPEQAKGESLDFRTDLYSLGATLFHMLTGQTPFKAKSSYGVISEVLKGQFVHPADIDPTVPMAVSDLIVKMMAYEPDQRPADADSVLEEIEKIEQDATIQTMIAEVPPPPKDRKLLIGLGVVLAAAVLGILLPLILIAIADEDPPEDPGNGGEVVDPNNGNRPPDPPDNHVEPVPPVGPVVKPDTFSFIYGDMTVLEDGRVTVNYDFSYRSQLDDWARDSFWWKRRIRRSVREMMAGLESAEDTGRLKDLRKAASRYTENPPAWKIFDSALVNHRGTDFEGCVNKLTFVGDLVLEFTAEVKKSSFPSLVVSCMNDQTGTGLSFNIGQVSRGAANLFIESERGERKRKEVMDIPFAIMTGVIYTVRIVREGDAARLYIEKGESILNEEPVFETAISGYSSGNVTLWSNMGLIKYYAVKMQGQLLDLNRKGWFVKAGRWEARDPGYAVTGYPDAEARLEYGGLPIRKDIRCVLHTPAQITEDRWVGLVLAGDPDLAKTGVTMRFGLSNGKVFLRERAPVQLKGERIREVTGAPGRRPARDQADARTMAEKVRELRMKKMGRNADGNAPGGGRKPDGRTGRPGEGQPREIQANATAVSAIQMREALLKETDLPEGDSLALTVAFEDDGIAFYIGETIFYKDIKNINMITRVSVATDTAAEFKELSIARRK